MEIGHCKQAASENRRSKGQRTTANALSEAAANEAERPTSTSVDARKYASQRMTWSRRDPKKKTALDAAEICESVRSHYLMKKPQEGHEERGTGIWASGEHEIS